MPKVRDRNVPRSQDPDYRFFPRVELKRNVQRRSGCSRFNRINIFYLCASDSLPRDGERVKPSATKPAVIRNSVVAVGEDGKVSFQKRFFFRAIIRKNETICNRPHGVSTTVVVLHEVFCMERKNTICIFLSSVDKLVFQCAGRKAGIIGVVWNKRTPSGYLHFERKGGVFQRDFCKRKPRKK